MKAILKGLPSLAILERIYNIDNDEKEARRDKVVPDSYQGKNIEKTIRSQNLATGGKAKEWKSMKTRESGKQEVVKACSNEAESSRRTTGKHTEISKGDPESKQHEAQRPYNGKGASQ